LDCKIEKPNEFQTLQSKRKDNMRNKSQIPILLTVLKKKIMICKMEKGEENIYKRSVAYSLSLDLTE